MPVPTEPVIFVLKFQVPELLEEGQPRIEEVFCEDFSKTWEYFVKSTEVEIDMTNLGVKSSQGKSEYELTQPVSDFFASIKGKRSKYSVFVYRKKAKRGRKPKTPKESQNETTEPNNDGVTPTNDGATPIKKGRGRPKVIKTIANGGSAVKSDEDPQNMRNSVAPKRKLSLKRKSVHPVDNGGEATPAKRRGRPPGSLSKGAKKNRKSLVTASSSGEGSRSNTADDDIEEGAGSTINAIASDLNLMKGLQGITRSDCRQIVKEFNDAKKRNQLSHLIPFTTSIICGSLITITPPE